MASKAIQRLNDLNDANAAITATTGNTSVYANSILIAVNGGVVAPHGAGAHSSSKTANGSSKVFINSLPVTHTGSADTCSHLRVGGSTTVFVCE